MRTHWDNGVPPRDEIMRQIARKNWGRWGENDERGALNLIDNAQVVAAAGLVRLGRRVSLARAVPTDPGAHNPRPAEHSMASLQRPADGGAVMDRLDTPLHGIAVTHLDALGHVWDRDGLWGGKDPSDVVGIDGVSWGGVETWRDGIVTRGVLVDVPRHRGTPYVTIEEPVHGDELAEIVREQGITLRPGDALLVHCGREAYTAAEGEWGTEAAGGPAGPEGVARPGLHPSCLEFIRDSDISTLVWDMLDSVPTGYGTAWSVHSAIFAYGVALVDNARLDELAELCAAERRNDFLFIASPLVITGGTGSPVNPLAIL